jgi:type VI secretion system protein VasG
LPDKAVSVLDTACARLALGRTAIPSAIEDATRTLDDLAVQTRVLDREVASARTTPSAWLCHRKQRAETEAKLAA